MRRPAEIAAALVLLTQVAGAQVAGAQVAVAAEIVPERRAELSHLVLQDCGSCHGMTLKGGLGSALLPDRLAGTNASALAEVILDGIPGTPMPPWRGLISDAEAFWIAQALKEGQIR